MKIRFYVRGGCILMQRVKQTNFLCDISVSLSTVTQVFWAKRA